MKNLKSGYFWLGIGLSVVNAFLFSLGLLIWDVIPIATSCIGLFAVVVRSKNWLDIKRNKPSTNQRLPNPVFDGFVLGTLLCTIGIVVLFLTA